MSYRNISSSPRILARNLFIAAARAGLDGPTEDSVAEALHQIQEDALEAFVVRLTRVGLTDSAEKVLKIQDLLRHFEQEDAVFDALNEP
jgi:hypothetical protein